LIPALAETLRLSPDARVRRAALRRAAPDRDGVKALIDEARSWRRRDPQSALRIARSALLVARAGREPEIAAEAAHVLGQAEAGMGRPRQALRRQRAAVLRIPASLRVSVGIEMAGALMLLGHEPEARSALADARRMAKGRQRAPLLAAIDVTEGNLLMRLDRDAEALALYERARPLAARRKRMTALATIDANRATALANLHRYAAADRMYARTARTYRRLGDEATALTVDYNRAYLQYLCGRFQRACTELADLQTRFAQAGNERFVALCDLDLAEVRLRLGDCEKAASHARAATDTLTRLGIAHDAARARLFLAGAERGLGRRDEARRALESARDALRDVGATGWEAVALERLAEIDAEDGLLDRALRRAHEAGARLLGLGLVDRAGRAEVLAARIELARGDARAARARLSAFSPRLRSLHAPWLSCEFHRESARAAAASGRKAIAVRHALEAVRVLERHRAVVPADEPLAAFHRERTATREEAVRLLLAAGGRTSIDRALALARSGKAQDAAAARPARGRRGRQARALSDEIDGLLGRMPTDDPHRRAGVAKRLADVAARKDRRLRALLGPAPAGGAPATGAGGRRRDTTVVEWFAATDETVAFARARGRSGALRLPIPRSRWVEVARRWTSAATAAGDAPAGEVLAWLRESVVEPLRGWVRTPRVVLVADGVLRGLPLAEGVRTAPPLAADVEVLSASE
jgi:tetratricopeptide (TPR) repeat protein